RLAFTSASTGSIMVAALPDDVLAEVLRRLAPRCLAACRCVCKPWRDLVDDRRLLLLLRAEELLPRPLAGIFLNFFGLFNSEFFARRPSTGAAAAISGDLDFLPTYTTYGSREHILLGCNNRQGIGSWILQDINYRKDSYTYEDDNMEELDQKKVECEPNKEAALEKFEWISDDENVLDNEDRVTGAYHGYIDIIGFHPYKEIIFLSESLKRGLAYHLSSSKVEDIGNLYPTSYNIHLINERFITASFPYTPCS
ncbi:Os03g0668100, partial [Oryza sativa Japonica Group]